MLCWIHKPMPGSIHEAHAGYNKLHGQFGKLHFCWAVVSGHVSQNPGLYCWQPPHIPASLIDRA